MALFLVQILQLDSGEHCDRCVLAASPADAQQEALVTLFHELGWRHTLAAVPAPI